MRITIEENGTQLRNRLRDRLDRAGKLKCADHGRGIESVTIEGRENGWFDSRYITCCERLEKQAIDIIKERC